MATTFELIDKTTLSSTASSITFSSIPADWTDLLVFYSLRSDEAANQRDLRMRFNGSTSGYSSKYLDGYGSSTGSGSDSGTFFLAANIPAANLTSNTFSNSYIYIPNYTSSNYKSASIDHTAENNATLTYMRLWAGLWSNTNAITEISLFPEAGNFVANSSVYIYGIKNS